MPKVTMSTPVAMNADKLWQAMGSFAAIGKWHVGGAGFGPPAEAMRRWGEASRALVALDPSYAWAHLELGAWYAYSMKEPALALAEFDRAIELAPNSGRVLAHVAENLPWLGQTERSAELLAQAAHFDPSLRFNWRQYQTDFFLGRFRAALGLIDSFDSQERWDLLFATLSQAQMGDGAATARWRDRLLASWPDFSWEQVTSDSGDFGPDATAERALWNDSLAKAGLPLCATPEQVAARSLRTLAQCDALRASRAAAAMP